MAFDKNKIVKQNKTNELNESNKLKKCNKLKCEDINLEVILNA